MGIEQHGFLPDNGEILLNFKIMETDIFGYNVFQKLPQTRNIPLIVAQFIKRHPRNIIFNDLKHFAE